MKSDNTFEIDNITWNDLSLDDIYSRLNSCVTSAGENYLRESLKNPYLRKCDEYDSFVKMIDESDCYKDDKRLKESLTYISKLNKYNFIDELFSINQEEKNSNIKHFIIDILIIISFVLIFVIPGPGIVAFFIMIAYSVSDYFKTKSIISSHLAVFNYLIRMIKAPVKYHIKGDTGSEEYNKTIARLNEIAFIFRPFIRGTYIISEGAKTTSNPLSILFDYIRMIFHLDIIKYNSMISFIIKNAHLAKEYYCIIGQIDASICVNTFKSKYISDNKPVCSPEFIDNKEICMKEAYHLLIDSPVTNSVDTKDSILITGCNASGKSTFLKMVAINIIFAQCFGFSFSKEYKAPFYKVYSSMALRDDISKGESYFIAEIKSLKRIIDTSEDKSYEVEKVPVFCIIDEVLRGTNTVERIAASVEILNSLNKDNILCFTATHDIELTELLKNGYKNYHFGEEFKDNDVIFSYKICEGPANSRNAIRLLKVLGYNEQIVERATKRVDGFLSSGSYVV